MRQIVCLMCLSTSIALGYPVNTEQIRQEDDIRESVFRYQMAHNPNARQTDLDGYFLAVGWRERLLKKVDPLDLFRDNLIEPSDSLMRRFDHDPSVHKASRCRNEVFRGIINGRTGKSGLLLLVTNIAWVSDSEVTVKGETWKGNLASARYTYTLKSVNGKWTVINEKMNSIS